MHTKHLQQGRIFSRLNNTDKYITECERTEPEIMKEDTSLETGSEIKPLMLRVLELPPLASRD